MYENIFIFGDRKQISGYPGTGLDIKIMGLQRGTRKLLAVMELFTLLIAVVIPLVYTHMSKLPKLYTLNMNMDSLLHVNYYLNQAIKNGTSGCFVEKKP